MAFALAMGCGTDTCTGTGTGMSLLHTASYWYKAAIGEHVQPSMNTYLGPRYIMWGAPAVQATGAISTDTAAAEVLWAESVRITGADVVF